MIKRVRELLKELDDAKFSNFNQTKIKNIETELEKLRVIMSKDADVDSEAAFIPYPEYTDSGFYSKIYNKKEFHKTAAPPVRSSATYEELVAEKCSPSVFKLTPNQIFLKNFMSPHTPYNGLLLYHGVGVGKCFAYDTPIIMADGSTIPVQHVRIGDEVMGDDSTPRKVQTLSNGHDFMFTVFPEYGKPYTVNSNHILSLVVKRGTTNEYINITVYSYLRLSKCEKYNMYGYRNRLTFFPSRVPSKDDPYLRGVHYGQNEQRYICKSIKYGSPDQRRKFLAGVFDVLADVSVFNDALLIMGPSRDIVFIAGSLGIYCENDGDTVIFSGSAIKHVPCRVLVLPTSKHPFLYSNLTIKAAGYSKFYGFGVDGNHKFMLGDFTVTHNSCSAISIAEQFSDVFNKKALVLMPTNLKDNFKKQIFDINKTGDQCTGSKYLHLVASDPANELLDKDVIEKKINRVISEKYEFMGFQEFANSIDKMKKNARNNESRFIARVKEHFSDRVIVIDEVHNVRNAEGTDKKVPPILLFVIQHAENVKLVLLTATPMFNEASEIVWLINLLLANDKRKLMDVSDVFASSGAGQAGKLTKEGVKVLAEASRGYVSFMRGENPFSFPLTLYPSINKGKGAKMRVPKFDIKGVPIPPDLMLQKLELVQSHMSIFQQSMYELIEKTVVVNDAASDDADEEADADAEAEAEASMDDEAKGTGKVSNSQMIQISNIVYPGPSKNPKDHYGRSGFNSCFSTQSGNGTRSYKVSYKPGVKEFLKGDQLVQYAPKIKQIVDSIMSSQGIVFVYSFFFPSGIIPMAIALEHMGFAKYGGNNILVGNNAKKFMIDGKQATYSILSPKKTYTPDFDKEVDAVKAPENAHGENIKVVLGSSVSAEGIDFKCIREVHILEPWYHLNKVQQIVGRAVRNCSHVALDPPERNVTVFHHVNSIHSRKHETIDERVYRLAENKQLTIDKIEAVLKQGAVDCTLNKNALFFDVDKLGKNIDIVTSQGNRIKKYALGDSGGGKHSAYKCSHEIKRAATVDESTFDSAFYKEDIDENVGAVTALFKRKHAYTYDEIHATMKNVDHDVLMFTLEHILKKRVPVIHGSSNALGYIIYNSDLYMFQPHNVTDTRLPVKTRKDYQRMKLRLLYVDNVDAVKKRRGSSSGSSSGTRDDTAASMVDLVQNMFDKMTQSEFQIKDRTDIVKKYRHVVYDYIVDRLDKKQLLLLARETLIAAASPFQTEMTRSLKEAHVIVPTENPAHPFILRDIFESEFYHVDGTKVALRELQTFDQKHINITVKRLRQFKGYLFVSKVRNTDNYVAKFKVLKEDKASNGFQCDQTSNYGKSEVIAAIQEYEKEMNTTGSKPVLCNIYELMLRANGQFGRPYESKLALKNPVV
jgi:hypothetical protein